MSLLLDALKKSERRQRAGQVPDLAIDAATPVTTPRGRGIWPALLVAVPVLLAIGWLSWQQYRIPVLSPAGDETGSATQLPEIAVAPSRPPDGRRPARSDVSVPVSSAPGRGVSIQPAEPVPRARTPMEETLPPSAIPAPDENTRSAVAAAEPASAPVLREPPPVVTPPSSPSAASAAPAGEGAEGAAISYWALPANVREGIQPLYVTVLVYSEIAENRFALVDGKRVRQGDVLANDVEVAEIRREGVVFRRGPYRFLIKP